MVELTTPLIKRMLGKYKRKFTLQYLGTDVQIMVAPGTCDTVLFQSQRASGKLFAENFTKMKEIGPRERGR